MKKNLRARLDSMLSNLSFVRNCSTFFAIVVLIIVSNQGLFAQCDVNQKYDKIMSGYHGSITLKNDGTYSCWGQTMKSDGSTDALVPQDINSTNYTALGSATIYKAAIGGAGGGGNDQMILLTSTGIFAWGGKGNVLKTTLTNVNTFGNITAPTGGIGSTTLDLPTGVLPTDVQTMFATYQTLVLVTKIVNNVGGNVYVLTQTTLAVEANGGVATTAGSSSWQQVKINSTTNLTNVTAVRGQVSSPTINAFMALTSTGSVYTWGNSSYLGNATASAARNYATLMTLPSEFSSSNIPAMIGVAGGIKNTTTVKNTYFILSSSGTLYSLGDNTKKQCGDFTTTERLSWVNCKSDASTNFSNVNFITCQEHNSASVSCVAAITKDGKLYDWGEDDGELLGRGSGTTTTYDPGIAQGSSGSVAITAEMGGHTLVYLKSGSTSFCYVGHKTNGSMGDNVSASSNVYTFDCTNTPSINICGYVPISASTTSSTITANPTSIFANGLTTTTVTVQLKDVSGNNLTLSGGTVVVNASSGTLSTVVDNNNGTYTVTLTSINSLTPITSTLSFTINAVAAINTATVNFAPVPVVNITGSLTAFTTCAGTASASQSISLAGAYLLGNIVLTAPAGYELSTTSGGTYSSTLSLVPVSGAVSSTTIYIRLQSSAVNGASGNISCASTTDTTQYIPIAAATVKVLSTSNTNLSICPNLLPYTWNGLTFNAAGTQTAHLTNSKGCDSAATLVLTVKATSTSTTNTTICSTALPYTWNGLTFNAAGSQTAHLTNSVGCDSAATLNLTVTTAPNAGTISGTQAVCSNGLTIFSTNGDAGGTWTSNATAVATINASTGVVSPVLAGTATITYTITGTGGCANATATRTVTVTTAPNAGTLGGTQAICSNGTVTFYSNGDAGGTWSSSPLSVATVNASTGLVTAVAAGVDTVKYTVTGTGGCANAVATRTVTVTAAPNAGTISGNQAICTNGTTTFTSNGDAGGTWTSSGTSIATVNASTGFISGVSQGVPTITYTLTGTGGCANATATRSVTVTAPPSAGVVGGVFAICSNGNTTLYSTGYAGGTWSSATPSVATVNASSGLVNGVTGGTAVISYTVAGTGGCANVSANNTVTVTQMPNAGTVSGNQAICSNGTTTFTSNGDAGGSWNTTSTGIANVNASTGIVTGAGGGTATISYLIMGTGGCGNSTATRTVTVTQFPNAGSVAGTQVICPSGSTVFFSNGDAGGAWTSGNTSVATVNVSSGAITPVASGSAVITYTVTGTGGCGNATANRTLTVSATSTSTTNISICPGASYTFNGTTYNTAGTYTYHTTNTKTCDSAATLILTVKATSTSTTNLSICPSALPYTWNGLTFNAAGTQTAHLTNAVGCDSAATLVLTVKATSTSTTNASICSGTSYTFNGTSYSTAGTYTFHTTNALGCDSAAVLVLTIKATSTSSTNLSICPSSLPYSWNGLTFNAAGTQTAHLTNSVGCDSAATLVLTVKATSTSTTNASICSGTSYTFNGTSYSTAGTYVYHTTNSVGCDSAAVLVLTVKATSTSSTNLSICPSALPYSWNGLTFNAAGTQTAHLTNAVGCDSAATLVLTVKATSTSITNASICSGSSYTFNGTSYSTAGTYTYHTINAVGCDSAASLVLTIKATSTSSTNLSICPSALPYSWNGLTFNAAGTQTAHLTNAVGCDSAATLVLTVKATSTSITNASICSGTSYTFNGTSYSTAGTYVYHTTNSVGCDSAASLVLTVKATSTSSTNLSVCPSALPYSWNGLTFNAAGTQTAHLTNAVGCDSAATLVLTVKATSTSTTNASICSGTSYIFNGTSYSTAGTYVYHTINAVGCDSAASLVLTVKATSTSSTNLSICPSALPYSWNGLTFNAAGTQTAHLTNAVGCDSAATLVLTVKATSTSTTNASICSGTSYTFNGTSYNTAGTYVYHTTNAVGCDSAASLVLTVKATSTSSTNLSICPSALPYSWNGLTFNVAGTQTAHLTNAVGCDSAATLVLIVKATSTSITNASICSGTSYSFNGTSYNTAGTYVYHTTNSVGCDSAASLVLTVKATSTSSSNLSICPSALPYSWNGLTFNAAGTQTAHLTNAVGCDSAATLVLIVKATSTSTTNASICSGTSYTFNGTSYSTAGTYTFHTTNAVGCDSAASLVLTVKATSTSSTNLSICPSALPYSWNGLTFNAAGTQTAHLTNAVGCDSAATLVLTVKATSTSITNASICSGTSYSFNGTSYSTAGTYTYHTTNAVGCDSAASLVLTVKAFSTSNTNLSICPSALPYSWNGLTFNAAGTQTAHLTNAVGCDSAATLVLTVKANSISSTNVTACSSYTWNGTTYTTSGTYTYSTLNALGCDSTATLILTVNYPSTSSTNVTACSSYTWNGSTYTTSGTYTYSTTNALGCDSTATLNLIVNYPSTSSTNVTACSSYTWNGSTYTTSGTYTYSTTNALGCDSTATLILTVNYPSTSSTNVTACSSYTWNGSTYTTSGTYTYSTLNALGCDSTATLNLIVNYPSSSSTNVTACSSYTWNGSTYTTSGTYTYSTTNALGCDSTATLNLTVNYPSTSTTNVTACSSYTWNGTAYTTSGTYTYSTTNALGCDSTATLNLTVNYPTTSSTNVTACSSYTWNGTTYTTSGTYTYSTTNALGCDSTATLNLTVNYPSTSSTNITACSTYIWNGTAYTTSGTYTYSTTNALGCDSTATLNLTVNYPSTSSTNVTACSSYTWNGTAYTTSGTYTYSTLNALGCDSTATLNLTVNYPSTSSTNVTTCSSYTWNSTAYTTSGTYTYSTLNALGCDSTATLNLTVNYPSTSITNVTACSSYTWNNTAYTTSGTYTYSTTNALGCDSIATLNLTVNYPSTSTTNVTACGTYTWNGTTYTTSGTYTYSTTNAKGCDSTATLNLTVNYPSTSSTNVIACSSYTWNGTTYTTSGTYIYSTLNAKGCDSTATLNLTINYPSTSSTNVTACSSYTWNGTAYTTSGTYTYSTTNALGCDSTATLNLTVNYPSTSSTNVTVCSSYTWNGTAYTTSGTYTYSTLNALGCDSTATLNLTVNYPSTSSTNVTACSSYTWNGTTYTTSGTYTYSTTNALGCDSTATLNLTVNYPSTSITNVTACSSYIWNGTNYTISGTYTYSTTNALGCDSTATLNLTVNYPSTSTTNVTACSSFIWNGSTYTMSGIYTYSTLNAKGCDSTATLNLIVNYPTTSSTNVTACSTYTWNGSIYTTSGTYTYSTLNAKGCDSTATLNLTVNYPSTSTTNVTACSSYTWNGSTYTTSGTYTYSTLNALGCDSTATLNLIVNYPSTSSTNVTACSSYTWNGTAYTTSGTYTFSTTNALGCDSTATLNLTVNYPSTSSTNVTACSSYTWNGSTYTTSGTYTYSTTNALGCDSTATLNLTVNYPSTSSTNVTACSSYTWNGSTYTTTGTYTYSTTNALGCDSTATLILTLNYPSTSSTNITACSSYIWNGTKYTTSGTYTYSTLNALGCDSTATLNLTVNYPSTTTTNVTACSSYTWNGTTYTTSGTYSYSTTNAKGCDSTATLNLIISNGTSSTTNASICNGSSYTFNGNTYSAAGTYLVFLTGSTGCDSVATLKLTVKQPTTSTTNVSICNGSSYVFNGITYNTSGTYTATLTNSTGCDSIATLNLTVSSVAQPTLQPIAGTSVVCTGDSTVLTNATLGGIWTVDSTTIATIDSITGLVKGLVQGAAVVSYTIGTPGTTCSATVSVPFTVNCDAVASGGTGGLESKGLGDAVAKRVYNAALYNTDNRVDYSRLIPVKTNNFIHVMGTTTPGTLALSDLMPAKESIGCGYKSYDMSSHVTDLTGFTNAEAIQTFDYVVNNETKGVTFLTRTYSNIYAHTKPVCDRLKEAKLLDIQQVQVNRMTFIQYKLQQNDGRIEYAISFSAGVKQNENKFNIQSIWLTRNYAVQDTMYNFQVWAVEPSMAKNMVNNILAKLNGVLPIDQLKDSVGIPTTYIRDITRTQNKLIMNIRNNTGSTNGTVNLTVRSNENMNTTSLLSVDVTLLPNAVTPVSIDVKDSYESDISLLVDNNLKDMVYMNDGNWNYSVSKSTIVPNRFTISNDGIMPTADEFRLFRNVTIDVNVPDYVSIYKMMKAGGLSRDVSSYKQLQFKASATSAGKLTIVIQKASITNWSEQYTYTMPVNSDLKDYAVNLKDFRSAGSNDTLTADDVVTVTFSFIGSGNNNHIVASLADVKFSKATITAPVTTVANNMNVFPNPAIDKFSVRFTSDKETKLNLQLVEMGSGRVILMKTVNAVVGENLVPVEVTSYISAAGHYVLMLGNETIRYTPFKIALRR